MSISGSSLPDLTSEFAARCTTRSKSFSSLKKKSLFVISPLMTFILFPTLDSSRFFKVPPLKSSSTVISLFSDNKLAMLDPMNPAPPVMRIFFELIIDVN